MISYFKIYNMSEQTIIAVSEILKDTVKSSGKEIYIRLYSDGHYREVNEKGYGNIDNTIFCFRCKEFHENRLLNPGNMIVCVNNK